MEEAKTMKTLISSSIKLDKDEKGKSIDSTMYRGMIESHLSVVKRILKYLKGIMDIGLWYPKSDNFELIGFRMPILSVVELKEKALVKLVIS
ncbi:hypothetical protein AAG906_013089 [Vitis piasezkii]